MTPVSGNGTVKNPPIKPPSNPNPKVPPKGSGGTGGPRGGKIKSLISKPELNYTKFS
jgi:hypothetical protein